MTIRKGQDWGGPGTLEPGEPVGDDDAEVAELLSAVWSEGAPAPGIGLLGGDLHRTLGEPHHDEFDLREGRGLRLPMDLGTVRIDGGAPRVFIAHLVAMEQPRRGLWSTRTVTAVNGSFVGPWNLGPRAHPNDGRLDITDGVLPRSQRRAGRRRALTGTHVPHPDLSERRTAHYEVDSAVPLHVELDGRAVGCGTRLEITCHPDAWVAVI